MNYDWEDFFNSNGDISLLNKEKNIDIDIGIDIDNENHNSDTDLVIGNKKHKINENKNEDNDNDNDNNDLSPVCTDIYISTKTKISFLNKNIDLSRVFWEIPIIPYSTQIEGVIKKQMKFNSTSKEELQNIQDKLENYKNVTFTEQKIIMQSNTDSGRNKYKDVRKISIGLRKKDIISNNCKNKSAFYNCFVLVLRIKIVDDDDKSDKDKDKDTDTCKTKKYKFHEINAKIFNTGKIEIPGIKTDDTLYTVLSLITSVIRNIDGYADINYIKNKTQTVLINSNFNCGYYINRENLFNILKYRYNIHCLYDPCSYPGILCEYYYNQNNDNDNNGCRNDSDIVNDDNQNDIDSDNESTIKNKLNHKGKKNTLSTKNNYKVSFMIFRTGSVLIVGNCNEEILNSIYVFIKKLLQDVYKECHTITNNDITNNTIPIETRKKNKKTVVIYRNEK